MIRTLTKIRLTRLYLMALIGRFPAAQNGCRVTMCTNLDNHHRPHLVIDVDVPIAQAPD